MEVLFSILIFAFFGVVPLWVAYKIAQERNRTGWKAIVVAFFFGWIGVLFLAMFLKVRDQKTGFLK